MYRLRRQGAKQDPVRRWRLPDRVFFACGACHILAYAFLERHGQEEMEALWIKPAEGYRGSHIVVAARQWVFDYHGYSEREAYLAHTFQRARQHQTGWDATFIDLPTHVLVSEAASRNYDGLWLREPRQFLHDALPRARRFLDRFGDPPE